MLTLLGRGGFARPVNALSAYKIPRRWKKKKAKGKASPDVNLGSQDENIDLSMYRTNMEKAVDVFRRDLGSIRTSGANPSILDNVKVEAYGALAALHKVAQVSVRDPRSLIVTVFDHAVIKSVEKAIRNAGLNLNPQLLAEGSGRITVPVPKTTKESREEMKKLALKEAENARVATRHIRRSAMQAIKQIKSTMPKDEMERLEKQVQSFTDDSISTIDDAVAVKLRAIDAP